MDDTVLKESDLGPEITIASANQKKNRLKFEMFQFDRRCWKERNETFLSLLLAKEEHGILT
jgi:hypothetical protein